MNLEVELTKEQLTMSMRLLERGNYDTIKLSPAGQDVKYEKYLNNQIKEIGIIKQKHVYMLDIEALGGNND